MKHPRGEINPILWVGVMGIIVVVFLAFGIALTCKLNDKEKYMLEYFSLPITNKSYEGREAVVNVLCELADRDLRIKLGLPPRDPTSDKPTVETVRAMREMWEAKQKQLEKEGK